MNKFTLISSVILFSHSLSAKKLEDIRIKTTYKRSKKIWGVYTLKNQKWTLGKKKHVEGAKDDHVLLRKKGKLVFIGPEFKEGLISYDVKAIPYSTVGKKKFKIQPENFEKLKFKKSPLMNKSKTYHTTEFRCSSKWSEIECIQVLSPIAKIGSSLNN
ncbi:hypothetical protein [Halobacteriovorax sp. HLS]|uniref:hypothetical protein n=1 Tax=Halobacteriovorax sp. HLS TaxID=2234000 RepID=UPI000FDB6174|nr:hypothetical protein [Halobacteriovorax sp. HLS]